MDVPGCIGIIAEPGDMILFSALTYHANMATNERRYSLGMVFRAKSAKMDCPWPLTESAEKFIEEMPDNLKTYVDGYVGINKDWKGAPELKAS